MSEEQDDKRWKYIKKRLSKKNASVENIKKKLEAMVDEGILYSFNIDYPKSVLKINDSQILAHIRIKTSEEAQRLIQLSTNKLIAIPPNFGGGRNGLA